MGSAGIGEPIKRGLSRVLWCWLIAALVIGAGFRIARLFDEPLVRADGKIRYEAVARNLAAGNGFSSDTKPPYRPQEYEMPGYPVFWAALLIVSGDSLRFSMLAQSALEVVTLLLVGAIAGKAISPRARLPAIGLGAGCLFLPSIATEFLTETLSIALTTTLFALLFMVVRNPSRLFLCGLTGVVAGLAILTRVDALLFVGLGVPTALALHSGRRVLGLVIFLASFFLTLLPWWLRDFAVLGRLSPPGIAQFSYSHVGPGYRRWMNTWVDKGADVEHYVWGNRTDFPATGVLGAAEREAAQALRARSLQEGVNPFSETVDAGFRGLALKAYRERPVTAFITAGLRRLLDSASRVPSLITTDPGITPLRLYGYAHWLALLVLALAGAISHPSREVLWLSLALIVSRLGIPFASAWGLETRYLYQAVPAVVLLGSVVFSRLADPKRLSPID